MDPYSILGLQAGASDDEVKQAYKKLAMKHHPDRGGDSEKFKEISEAYEKIKSGKVNESQSNDYDPYDYGFGGFGGFDWDDIIARHRRSVPFNVTLRTPFKTAILGSENEYLSFNLNGIERSIKISIPAGTINGTKIRYPKLIDNRDVIITFVVTPDPNWAIEGLNLITNITVNVWDLIIGSEVNVKLLDDSVVKLKVPEKTQPNTHLRLKGKGIKKSYFKSGDVIVRVNASIPQNIPSEILEAIKKNRS